MPPVTWAIDGSRLTTGAPILSQDQGQGGTETAGEKPIRWRTTSLASDAPAGMLELKP